MKVKVFTYHFAVIQEKLNAFYDEIQLKHKIIKKDFFAQNELYFTAIIHYEPSDKNENNGK